MHILILNWRDSKNPRAGGAELLTHEIAKRLAHTYSVTQFSSHVNGQPKIEIVDGVRIIRRGSWWLTHLHALYYYIQNHRQIDIVIDEVHWFPYFSYLYAREKTIVLVCEVAHALFFRYYPDPVAFVWRLIEKAYLYVYRSAPTLAISPSTKKALVSEGFDERNITVLPMGVTIMKATKKWKKEKTHTYIYFGRVSKLKGVEDAIRAFSIEHKKDSSIQLWIAGGGDENYIDKLTSYVAEKELTKCVHFFGFITEQKKVELLSRAHVLLLPSQQEGWGLVIVESALCHTPAITYDVAGVRDIITHRHNGLLVSQSVHSLSKAMSLLRDDHKLYVKLQRNAFANARTYNWDNTADAVRSAICELYEKNHSTH